MAEFPQEITNYPSEPQIFYKEKNRSFRYTILKEGVYPAEPKYTLGHNYKIPDNYEIKSTWSKNSNQWTVKCSIDYINNKPMFRIFYGQNFENQVESDKTASNAATLLHNVCEIKSYYFKS